MVNSPALDMAPVISPDGLTLFVTSERPDGCGSLDIWVTRRETIDEDWGELVNLGQPINSSAIDIMPSISTDSSVLYLNSSRFGGYGELDIWQVLTTPNPANADINGDGKVNLKDFSKLAQFWSRYEPSVDIAPAIGDAVVDFGDIAFLAEFWLTDFRLIANWKLDETEGNIAYDSVGNNYGTIYGNPIWQPIGGTKNGGLLLDGIDDYISTKFMLSPAGEPFSVFAWIKDVAPGQVVISQANGTSQGSAWLYTDPSYG
jgi:hypothetical protein